MCKQGYSEYLCDRGKDCPASLEGGGALKWEEVPLMPSFSDSQVFLEDHHAGYHDFT